MTTVRPPMTAVRRWQIGLIALGIVLLGIGGLALGEVNPKRYLGIAAWFVGALILHDGIAAMIVLGVSVVLRKIGRRIPFAVLAIVQGALVIAAIVTALVLPEIIKKGISTANPTILPLDYAAHLGYFYAGLAVLTALAIVVYFAIFARRQNVRSSATHD